LNPPHPETLVRVVGPTFVAGIVVMADRFVESAPYLRKFCLGRTSDQLRALFAAKGWRASVVPAREG